MQTPNENSSITSSPSCPPGGRRNIFINPWFNSQDRGVDSANCFPSTSGGSIRPSPTMPPVWPNTGMPPSAGLPRFPSQIRPPPHAVLPTARGCAWPPPCTTMHTHGHPMPPSMLPVPPPGLPPCVPMHHSRPPMSFPTGPPPIPPPGPPPFGLMPPQAPLRFAQMPTCGPLPPSTLPPWNFRQPNPGHTGGMFPVPSIMSSSSMPSPVGWQSYQARDRFTSDETGFSASQSNPFSGMSTSRFNIDKKLLAHQQNDDSNLRDRERQRDSREREHRYRLRKDRSVSSEQRGSDTSRQERRTDRELRNNDHERRTRDRSPRRDRQDSEPRRNYYDSVMLKESSAKGKSTKSEDGEPSEPPEERNTRRESRYIDNDRRHHCNEKRRSPLARKSQGHLDYSDHQRRSTDVEAGVFSEKDYYTRNDNQRRRKDRGSSFTESNSRRHSKEEFKKALSKSGDKNSELFSEDDMQQRIHTEGSKDDRRKNECFDRSEVEDSEKLPQENIVQSVEESIKTELIEKLTDKEPGELTEEFNQKTKKEDDIKESSDRKHGDKSDSKEVNFTDKDTGKQPQKNEVKRKGYHRSINLGHCERRTDRSPDRVSLGRSGDTSTSLSSSRSRSCFRSDSRNRRSHSRAESGYHSPTRCSSSTRYSPLQRRSRNNSSADSVTSRCSQSKDRSESRRRSPHTREPSTASSRICDQRRGRSREPSGSSFTSFQRPKCPSQHLSSSRNREEVSRHSQSRAGDSADPELSEEDADTRTLREFLTSQSVKLGKNTLNACLNFDTKPRQYDDVESEESVESDEEKTLWLRCSPADLYYKRSDTIPGTMIGTAKLVELLDRFKSDLVDRAENIRSSRPSYEAPPRKEKKYPLPTTIAHPSDSEEMSEDDDSSDDDTTEKELERKRLHPDRLHSELWFNEPGEMNDGPACRCSARARDCGIRHGIYPGEEPMPPCNPNSNNANRLFHYRITMSPHINFLTKIPTIIPHDGHEFIFEGFSMFSHYRLVKLPTCKVIRFNIEYTIHYIEEKSPEHFTIRELELFYDYLYREILELVDLNMKAHGDKDGCKRFHFFPRFARSLEDSGKEILSMNEVLSYLLASSKLLLCDEEIPVLMKMKQHEWQNYADEVKGQIVTYPGKRPCSLRVDQLDRDLASSKDNIYPEIIHFGIRPLQLSYAGNPTYRKSWHEYVKYRHLLANKPKVTAMDRHKLLQREVELQDMRTKSTLKRDVTVVISSQGFYRTGIMCDMTQHAMLLPVLVSHLRFHNAMDVLEGIIDYRFKNRHLLQLAMTHPSFRENFGTNPDHARNSLTNCGIRQPVYGDRRIHYVNTRKRGINTLITIMAKFGKDLESYSNIKHNERLEFLGDAVVEFHSSIHLYHLFPELEEGGLATYRAAIVQNQHLAVLAKRLQLERFMLYAHGSDLCHDLELRHAMANCFEAVMGALFIDAGVEVVDRIFSKTLFPDPELHEVWVNYPLHPLQEQEPNGDRQWVESVPLLKKLRQFELDIGIDFNHIRLLARAFTHRSVGFNNLTLGSNQRMEFLGDTILQLIASEYLFRHFPEHHEGHLSLLRSSLVNNRTQAVVCDDLGMVEYVIYAYANPVLKIKDKADLLEAFVGALYVDKGLDFCKTFCHVCFFPRLRMFIMNQDWNDPKSKLQQCCLTLRTMEGGEPDIPIYKVIECKGPTNTRVFTVAVYFRGQRLAKGTGHSIQRAEMAAAKKALESQEAKTWPQLKFQRKVIQKSIHMDKMMRDVSSREKETACSGGGADQNKISLWVDH